ncbi:MAG TPA: hypothetical protein VFM14_05565 [Gemmatimonadales bacterium]|nr:hypothetical protein [Gemmatimonadales bacterium]
MMSYQAYKVIHLVGIFLTLGALAGLALAAANGATKQTNPARRLIAVFHGVGLFVLLLGGFGLLARLGITHGSFPGWVWAKLGLWVLIGALVAVPYRRPDLARAVFVSIPLLGGLAAWLAIFKPF